MDYSRIQPQSVDGLKRLAKRIKKDAGIPHATALDVAAQQAGFQNFVHFRNQVENGNNVDEVEVLLTSRWRNPRSRGDFGTLEARILLSRPIPNIVTGYGIEICPRLGSYKLRDGLTLADQRLNPDKTIALRYLGQAARTLQFIDATGLKPARARRSENILYPSSHRREELPKADHASFWREPRTDRILCMNEPYWSPDQPITEQQAWANRNGFGIQRLDWGSLYWLNGGTICDLIAHRETGADIDSVVNELRKAPCPFDEDRDNVKVYSGFFH